MSGDSEEWSRWKRLFGPFGREKQGPDPKPSEAERVVG